MAKGQDNGITMLLGLKDYTLGEVWGGGNRVTVKTEVKGREECPHYSSGRLYSHGESKPEGSTAHLEQR